MLGREGQLCHSLWGFPLVRERHKLGRDEMRFTPVIASEAPQSSGTEA